MHNTFKIKNGSETNILSGVFIIMRARTHAHIHSHAHINVYIKEFKNI